MLNRDQILTDLKTSVIEFYFYNNLGIKPVRLTLREDLLPKSFNEDVEQKEDMETYHKNYPSFIGAMNVSTGLWHFIDVNTLTYTQMIDGY